jgi:hypothetical protein
LSTTARRFETEAGDRVGPVQAARVQKLGDEHDPVAFDHAQRHLIVDGERQAFVEAAQLFQHPGVERSAARSRTLCVCNSWR